MGEKLKKIIRTKQRSLSMEFFSCVFWCLWCLVPGCIMPYRYLPLFCKNDSLTDSAVTTILKGMICLGSCYG